MVSFIRKPTDASNPTLEKVADHIQHVGNRIGYEHVGIGSDFDGVMLTASGVDDVSKFPLLMAELLNRGVPDQSIKNMMGLNVLRVMDAVDKTSTKMRDSGEEMLQDVFEEIWDEKMKDEVRQTRDTLN